MFRPGRRGSGRIQGLGVNPQCASIQFAPVPSPTSKGAASGRAAPRRGPHSYPSSAARVRATRALSGAAEPLSQNTLAARYRSRTAGDSLR